MAEPAGSATVYRRIVASRLRGQLAYRTSFALDLTAQAIGQTIELFVIVVVFTQVSTLGGFTAGEVLLSASELVSRFDQNVAASLSSSNAISLIGRTVTYTDENDLSHTGVVQKVTTAGGIPSLTVDGVDGIDPATISQVA